MTDPKRVKRGAVAHRTGLLAEDAAARFLQAQGFEILEKRHRTPHGEIDLIARQDATLVFVEVKARPSRAEAAYAISPRQWKRLGAAALHVMAERGETGDMRFDVVLVGGDGLCQHIENAAQFDEW